ncbi:MAG: precorrin-3B C(17)-methyltransferase [Isosphaeraceae bacterium]|nr:precorrin-3B C(17)-methyltransferase [Isosphaeraceae bacterium]
MDDQQRNSGTLFIVGLGPGAPGLLAPDAAAAIDRADAVVGYQGYLDQIADRLEGKALFGRALGEEVERARLALGLAHEGRQVALVSSGDAGIYGMGGVAFELAAERGTDVEIVVVPGITAACAAAARLGAPLAHDWACVSLSDLLTPWEVILDRVDAAARADFVLVFYNPASRARTNQVRTVAERLLRVRLPATLVGLVENAFRPGERIEVVSLQDLADGRAHVNMFTTVVVGSSRTFLDRGRMVTPRIYAAKHVPEMAHEPVQEPPGDRIMAESLAIIERELGPEPVDIRERAVLRRVIHASADFDFAQTLRFSPTAIEQATTALRSGATVLCDVEMLRAGVRRDLTGPLGVEAVCALHNPAVPGLAASEGLTRSAAGIRVAERAWSNVVVAVGNAPTALDEALRLVVDGPWRPACLIGLPVGFVGVEAAKARLIDEGTRRGIPFITNVGRKGGTAVTAAVVNALLELAAQDRRTEPRGALG